MTSNLLIAGIIIVVLVLVIAYPLLAGHSTAVPTTTISASTTVSGYSTTQFTTTVGTTNSSTTSTTTTIHPTSPGIVLFNVTEKDYYFTPNTFVINVSQTAYFNVTNDGMYEHDLGIYSLGSQWGTPVLNGGGGKGVFQFNASGPGNYVVYSNVGNDRVMGMVGMLVIR